MLPANSSGLTTQKIVLSVSSGSASRTVSIVTITLVRSGDTPMLFTVPMTTFLYLSCDWPAVRPAALSKAMVMVGPLLEKVSQASQRAIRRGEDRHDPDQRDAAAAMHARCWQLYRPSRVGHRPFNLLAPKRQSNSNCPGCHCNLFPSPVIRGRAREGRASHSAF